MKSGFFSTSLLTFIVAIGTTGALHADIYRWVDKKTGEIVFAETPPPPEVTTEYENITPKLKQRELSRNSSKNAEDVVEEDPADGEINDNVISDQDLLLQHRCQNLTAQIDGLERLITETSDDDEMDRLVVRLAEYEKKRSQRCE